MNELKAIPTVYKGIEFRSRLEARWAVFFDACGVNWEYEPEGFELPDGTWYLPDFLLHNVHSVHFDSEDLPDLWVEVKGKLTKEDLKKVRLFSGAGNWIPLKRKLTEEEEKRIPSSISYHPSFDENGESYALLPITHPIIILGSIPKGNNVDELLWDIFIEKASDSEFNFDFIDNDLFSAFPGICEDGKFGLVGSDGSYTSFLDEEKTYQAYQRALSAKFEHGQTPLTTPVWKEGK